VYFYNQIIEDFSAMSFRHAVFAALSAVTLAVAPATAQISNSSELDMPITRVSELSQPVVQPKPQAVVETEEQFPKVSDLEQVSVTPVQPEQLEVVNPGTCKECSQTKSESVRKVPLEPSRVEQRNVAEYSFNTQLKLEPFHPVEPSQPQLEPSRVIEQKIETQPLEPSRVLEQETVTPPPAQNTSTKSDTQEQVVPTVQFSQFNLEPSRVNVSTLEPSRIVPTQRILEPSRDAANNIVPFNAKGRLNQVEPSQRNTPIASNNIVSFNPNQRLVNQVEPSQPVVETREPVSSLRASPARPVPPHEGIPSAHPVTLANRTERTQTGIAATLEAPEGLNRDFGTSYPGVTPETAFSLDREYVIPSAVRTTTPRNTNVRTLSTRAADLGGAVTVQQDQPVVVETPVEAKPKPEPKPKPKGNLSVGVSGIGGSSPTLETSAGIEYNGFSTTVSFNHPLQGTGQDTIGLATTLPLSDRASVTIKADEINIDPIISATVESKISNRLTGSISLNSINRPDFNAELAAKYEINQHWSTNASFNLKTRQLNVGATYTNGRGFDATVKVDNIAENPQLGVGLGLELSSSTRLELSANNLNSSPTFGVKAIFSF
jgi:hypothetical protein